MLTAPSGTIESMSTTPPHDQSWSNDPGTGYDDRDDACEAATGGDCQGSDSDATFPGALEHQPGDHHHHHCVGDAAQDVGGLQQHQRLLPVGHHHGRDDASAHCELIGPGLRDRFAACGGGSAQHVSSRCSSRARTR